MPVNQPPVALPTPSGGWPCPWPLLDELAQCLPPGGWSLVGGLMVQAHAVLHGVPARRPTCDVDLLLDLSAGTRAWNVADALRARGFALRLPVGRDVPAHRFTRQEDLVDVLVPDHAPPRVLSACTLQGRHMVRVEGGTQALRRTLLVRACIVDGHETVLRMPSAFGALILKAAAHRVDARDRERHLLDAVTLLACLHDLPTLQADLAGSDRGRLLHLQRALERDGAEAWAALPVAVRSKAQHALATLCEPTS
jgi:hypothetical protein